MMQAVIATITSELPAALVEIRKLGRTMKQRAADILAFFDRPGTSNGPTEAINGRLEHLRGSALGAARTSRLHRATTWQHSGNERWRGDLPSRT